MRCECECDVRCIQPKSNWYTRSMRTIWVNQIQLHSCHRGICQHSLSWTKYQSRMSSSRDGREREREWCASNSTKRQGVVRRSLLHWPTSTYSTATINNVLYRLMCDEIAPAGAAYVPFVVIATCESDRCCSYYSSSVECVSALFSRRHNSKFNASEGHRVGSFQFVVKRELPAKWTHLHFTDCAICVILVRPAQHWQHCLCIMMIEQQAKSVHSYWLQFQVGMACIGFDSCYATHS